MSILISDPDQAWSGNIFKYLSEKSHKVDVTYSGRDCQLKVFKNSYDTIVLDFDIKNHSCLEVLRYMKLNHPKIKVILTFVSKERFSSLELTKEEVLKLGVAELLIKPFSLESLLKCIEEDSQFESWKKVSENKSVGEESELSVVDEEFTHIRRDSFQSRSTTIFDLYIRLSKNKYVKVLNKGDFFDESRLAKYASTGGAEFLYFKTKDRGIYINFINDLLAKSYAHDKGSTELRIKSTKNLAEKYIEEIYTSGLKPQLIEEGKMVCQNIHNLVTKDKGIHDILNSYEDYDPPAYAHLFLTSFISVIISKNLDWSSDRTVEMTAMAGLLHDIGLLRLPPDFREKKVKDMTAEDLALYKTHPQLGMEMLQKYSSIPSPVMQIVYQHHELANGTGFPNGLSASKIYPLAKISSLANEFTHLLVERKLTPLQGIKEFITDRDIIAKFDATVLRSLVLGFVKDKK